MGTMMSTVDLKSKLKSGAAFLEDVYGGAAIIMALMTPIIIGGLAFGAEVGGWEMTKRKLQNAADVAAYAAGTQVRQGVSDASTLASFSKLVAEKSGYGGGASGVDVEYPPATAPLAADGTDPNGDNSYVFVTLTESKDRVFTRYFVRGSNSISFETAALAKIENGRPACVLSLNPSAAGAIYVSGSADLALTGCDIAANSISQQAVQTNGNSASVETNCVSTVGGVDDSHNILDYTECAQPIENAAVTPDPYRNVTMPTCGTPQNANTFTNGGNPKNHANGGCWGTNSGTNSISITKTINLASNNTYIFKNVAMTINGNGVINGTNVTLVFEGNSSLTINGGGTMNITAPTAANSPTKGIAIFGDRNYDVDLDVSGNSGVAVVGAIYSPNRNSKITYIGNTSGFLPGQCTQVIGGTVAFTGSADLDTDCSASGTLDIKTAQSIKIVG